MRPKRLSFRVEPKQEGLRLDQVLTEQLPGMVQMELSKAKIRKLIVAGAVYLNGTRVRIASKPLRSGAVIDIYFDPAKLQAGDSAVQNDRLFEMSTKDVLFEDHDLIVVNKPPGLPTQPTLDEARLNLVASVKKFISGRDGVVQSYLGLHHRLDRDTSGVILFTKDPRANVGIAREFSEHRAQKYYQAIVGIPPALPPHDWSITNYLGKAPGSAKRTRYTAVRSGGDYAQTEFKLLEALPAALWVEAKPKTGRTHQIRVHLSEQGMPILGDRTYGRPRDFGAAPRLMLHAAALTFEHPITHQSMTVRSPLPEDFKNCLLKLGSAWAAR